MISIHQFCHPGLEKASKTMRKFYDEKDKPAPVSQSGNLVILKGKTSKPDNQQKIGQQTPWSI